MILKGSQRGGSQQLAVHLLKVHDNEHVPFPCSPQNNARFPSPNQRKTGWSRTGCPAAVTGLYGS
jgi:hypothetical protein